MFHELDEHERENLYPRDIEHQENEESDESDALESATDLEEKLEIAMTGVSAQDVHSTEHNNVVPIKGFFKLADPADTDTGGYVAAHWPGAIRIVNPETKKVLFECELMIVYKEDFHMAEELKQKIQLAINQVCEP